MIRRYIPPPPPPPPECKYHCILEECALSLNRAEQCGFYGTHKIAKTSSFLDFSLHLIIPPKVSTPPKRSTVASPKNTFVLINGVLRWPSTFFYTLVCKSGVQFQSGVQIFSTIDKSEKKHRHVRKEFSPLDGFGEIFIFLKDFKKKKKSKDVVQNGKHTWRPKHPVSENVAHIVISSCSPLFQCSALASLFYYRF